MWLQHSLAQLANVTQVFSVNPPLPDYGSPLYSETLLTHSFQNSWNQPAVVPYRPPEFDFNQVVLELNWSSYGVQFDRLAHIYLNGVEVWRPSTPEPGSKNISSNLAKDVSALSELFQHSGVLEVQLDNVMDDHYTGPFDTVLTIKYFNSTTKSPQWYSDGSPKVETLQRSSLLYYPPPTELDIPKVPRNTTRAGLIVYASGNAEEEFWYGNGLDDTGPTRLIKAFIDDELAAIIDPFQPIYTGGNQPRLWSPIVGVNTYDVPSYFVDISSFLPDLWTESSKLTFKVVNGFNNDEMKSNWLFNVALVSWESANTSGLRGSSRKSSLIKSDPVTRQFEGMSYVHFGYSFTIDNVLYFEDGSKQFVKWHQNSAQSNAQLSSPGQEFCAGLIVGNTKAIIGKDAFSLDYEYPLSWLFSGPNITVDYAYIVDESKPTGFRALNNTMKGWWGWKNESDVHLGWQEDSFPYYREVNAVQGQVVQDTTWSHNTTGLYQQSLPRERFAELARESTNSSLTKVLHDWVDYLSVHGETTVATHASDGEYLARVM